MRKVYLLAVAGAIALAACMHTPDYELCDTPNCGDDVTVEVE